MSKARTLTQPAHGFTLMEVMAVVALIGLLAAATAWSMADSAQQARRSDVIDRLRFADQGARIGARRLGPSVLCFDLTNQRVWVTLPGERRDTTVAGHAMKLGRGYRIERVSWVDPTRASRRGGDASRSIRVETNGLVELPISSAGLSRAYAIKLVGPADNEGQQNNSEQTERASWLLVSGLTGQVTIENDEEAIETTLQALADARPDAD